MSEMVPKIRFQGFREEWGDSKLKQFLKPSTDKNSNGIYSQKDVLAASLGTELIPKRTFFGLKSTEESVKNYRVVNKGDLIYTKSPIKGFPNGIIRSNKGNVGIVPSLYCVYQLQRDVNPDIIQLYFEDRYRLDSYLFPLVNVGARNNVNITDLEFLEGMIVIPKSTEEQKKIVEFIEHLNSIITFHRRKLDLLKEQKKGLLQKMFPKNDQLVPEVRFAGFTDDWEQRKLDTIFKKIRNAFVGTATPYYVDKGHFYLESNNVKNGQINRDTEIFINDEFYNKQSDKLLHTGDIVMVQSGHVGHSAVIPPELDGIAAHALIMLTNYKEETNPFFLNYQFQTYKSKKRLDTITTGNTIKHILSSEMKEFIVDYPSFEEQQKIGTFLQQLDNLITLHQRKLDSLKEQKKGFLQKMFVS